ncbi:phage tail tape-measure protein, partial [Enterobacter roggenkampii]|nr:phage tail tape-measure protein [Enterobacter roggenkampii]
MDPLAQINLQETQKLEAIAKYQELDKQNTQLYEDAKTAIQLQASNARMQIAQTEADQQRASVLSILGSASQGFDSLASIIADSAGKSNAAYQVMFAASKAFAIAQSTLSLNTAIMQAMADPTALTPAQKLANYAAIASAGA